MRHRLGLTALIFTALTVLLILLPLTASHAGDEAPSGLATVANETLNVYSGMSESANVVKTLGRGDSVSVQFELDRSGDAWCGVSEAGGTEVMGYVMCNGLDQQKAKVWTRTGTSTSESVSVQSTTPIEVMGNHAIVTVTLGYQNRDVNARLLLDTGASGTAINKGVAARLGLELDKSIKVNAMTMGGDTIEIKVLQLDYMKVGPNFVRDAIIGVFEQNGEDPGFDGVLGMDFLSGVEYKVDLENKVIRWGH